MIFTAGAAIGSVVTFKVVKSRYEQILQDALESTRGDCEDDYAEEDEDEGETPDPSESVALNEMRNAYHNIAQEAGYTEGYLKDREVNDVEKPYIISPEEFDTLDGYGAESLNYYADGVLTDQYDNIIDYPEEIIGDIDPSEHFGEYEQDSVHVRNDVTVCDYEILRDTRKFSEAYPGIED